MRKPIIVGNWKMNKTIAEAVAFIEAVDPVCHDGATYGVGTSFLALNDSIKAAKNLIVAAENCHFQFFFLFRRTRKDCGTLGLRRLLRGRCSIKS